jgi:hypothetical protein
MMVSQIVGNSAFPHDRGDFACIMNGNAVVPLTNIGAIYFFLEDIAILSFSVVVLVVFYVIPDQFKLIARSYFDAIPRL